MEKTACIILGLILQLSGFSQSDFNLINFKNDISLSNENGKPIDSTTLYFPLEMFIQKYKWFIYRDPWSKETIRRQVSKSELQIFETELSKFKIKDSTSFSSPDTSINKGISYDLFKLNEPILYNFYLGKETFRFTCLSSIYPPVTIRIEIENNETKIFTKQLERMIGSILIINNTDTIFPDNNIPLSINTERVLSYGEIERIRKVIDSTNFYRHDPFSRIYGVDGSEWIFESHSSKGYYFLYRFDPDATDPVYILGDYFLRLSDIKK